MTKSDVLAWIEAETASFPKRTVGNEVNAAIAQRIRPLIEGNRTAVIEALRDLIGLRVLQAAAKPEDSVREAKLWLALEVAASNRLVELRDDLRALRSDVRDKKSFLPYYEEMLAAYERQLT